jgi:hypothetical protein
MIQATVLRYDMHATIGSYRAEALSADAERQLGRTKDVGEHGALLLCWADEATRLGDLHEARLRYKRAQAECITAGRGDDGLRGAIGEAFTQLLLDKPNDCRRILSRAKIGYREVLNPDARARMVLVELMYAVRVRSHRDVLLKALEEAEAVSSQTRMSIRIDLLTMRARAYARCGMRNEALRVADLLETDVRSIVSNLEDTQMARGFLDRIGYSDFLREMSLLEERSARVSATRAQE